MSTEDLGKLILLIAGLLALLASSLIDSGDTTQATLEWVRGHDTQAYIATLIGLAAVPFYLGGVVADWLSMREVDARLALLAAVSFTVGYVGLAAIGGSQGLAYVLAADETVELKNLAATMESDKLPLLTEQVMAFGGWIGGIIGLGIGVVTARSSSRLATLGLLSVPFPLALPALWSDFPADEVAGVLFLGGAALWTIPILRIRFGGGT
jgi:hypothetical protein